MREWDGRGFVNINGGLHLLAPEFTDDVVFADSGGVYSERPLGLLSAVAAQEEAHFSGAHTPATAPGFDAGAGVRVAGNFALGVAVSYAAGEGEAAVSARAPHPIFDNRDREFSGPAAGLRRQELGVHVQALYLVPVTDSFTVTLFGGPTMISLQQDLVADVEFRQEYPFETAAYERAIARVTARSRWDCSRRSGSMVASGGIVAARAGRRRGGYLCRGCSASRSTSAPICYGSTLAQADDGDRPPRGQHRVDDITAVLEALDQADALREVSGPTDPPDLVFPSPTPQAAPRRDVLEARPGAEHRRRAARLPLLVPRLGRGADRPPARGHRDRPCARRRQRHRAGYARSDLFERRRPLMQDWDDYLRQPRGQVIPMRR